MPSDRQRALERIRQTPASVPLSQSICRRRSSAFLVPSMWCALQCCAPLRSASGSWATISSTSGPQCLAKRFEEMIVFVKAMARRSRAGVPPRGSAFSGSWRARQHPATCVASPRLIFVRPPFARWRRSCGSA